MPNNIPRRYSLVGSKVQILAVNNLTWSFVCINVYLWSEKQPFCKIQNSDSFKIVSLESSFAKPIPRHQIHPSSFGSFEVIRKNLKFGPQKWPFWKIHTSDSFGNGSIGKLKCQILFLDTKISLLSIIVLKLWAIMYIFGPKSGHFEKLRTLTVSQITPLESSCAKTYS